MKDISKMTVVSSLRKKEWGMPRQDPNIVRVSILAKDKSHSYPRCNIYLGSNIANYLKIDAGDYALVAADDESIFIRKSDGGYKVRNASSRKQVSFSIYPGLKYCDVVANISPVEVGHTFQDGGILVNWP